GISIYMNVHRLPRSHARKLSFFEICGNPAIILHDGHQSLPGLDPLSDLDGSLAYTTGDGAEDVGIGKLQHRLVEIRPGFALCCLSTEPLLLVNLALSDSS